MADPMMALQSLLAKNSHAEFLRSRIGCTARHLMDLEVEGRTVAACGQRSAPRQAADRVPAMGRNGISKSPVPRLGQNLDTRVQAFLTRPLTGAGPYHWLDATDVKVRDRGRLVPVAGIIALARRLGRELLARLPPLAPRSRARTSPTHSPLSINQGC